MELLKPDGTLILLDRMVENEAEKQELIHFFFSKNDLIKVTNMKNEYYIYYSRFSAFIELLGYHVKMKKLDVETVCMFITKPA